MLTLLLPVYAQFGGGSGTAQDPYLIQNATHLNHVRSSLNSHYLQTSPINLNVAPYNQGTGWQPIGGINSPFTGAYDGGGYSITGLYINITYSIAGLFGKVTNAEITRVRLENANISSTNWVGSLVGICINSELSSCIISANITGETYVGGIAGELQSSSLRNCLISASISTNSGTTVGGLGGYATGSSFNTCRTSGSCTGDIFVGGLCGEADGCVIYNCHSNMQLVASLMTGGLVGDMSTGSMESSYFNGTLSVNSDAGGLIATASDVAVTHCYWNTQTSGTNASEGGEGRTTDQMTYPYASNTYVGWDFTNIWAADSTWTVNGGYPYIRNSGSSDVVDAPTFSHASGYYNASFMLSIHTDTNNATIYYTLDGTQPTIQSSIYTAPLTIAASTTVKAYATRSGWIDSITSTASYYLGMFGGGAGTEADPYLISTPTHLNNIRYAMNACFKQTNDIDMDVEPYNTGSGWTPIGFYNGTVYDDFRGKYDGNAWKIQNLYMNANVPYAGLFGIAANAEFINITLEDIQINAQYNTSGLVGYCTSSTIDRCCVSGSVMGTENVGGLFGFLGSSNVTNCFSRAAVSGTSWVGGFCGMLYNSSNISSCYSTGLVSCSDGPQGGLIGATLTEFWTVSSSYWNVNTSGQTTSAAGIGATTEQMTYPYAPDCYVGWNFNNTWRQDVNGVNGGYPIFYRRVEMPSISHPAITPGMPTFVSMECQTPGSSIHYTLDGTTPDENSPRYSGPFTVVPDADSLVVVKAIGAREGFVSSFVRTIQLSFSPLSDPLTPMIPGLSVYPNPTVQSANIKFMLPVPLPAKLQVYNIKGQVVRTLSEQPLDAGEHIMIWDGKDSHGDKAATGIYFIRLEAGANHLTQKLILVE